MKILKAILLIFIVSLTVSNVSAQVPPPSSSQSSSSSQPPSSSQSHESGCGFGMSVESASAPAGQVCFNVTLNSDITGVLYIEAEGNPTHTSINPVGPFSATVCTDKPNTRPKLFYIECGTKDSDDSNDITCKEGCVNVVNP